LPVRPEGIARRKERLLQKDGIGSCLQFGARAWHQQGQKRITRPQKIGCKEWLQRMEAFACAGSEPDSRFRLALTGFEALLGLVDDVNPALAADQTIVAMPPAQGLQRITDFHGVEPRVSRRKHGLFGDCGGN
jgi:hypothetical protein